MRQLIKPLLAICLLLIAHLPSFCWGFFAHQKINYYAVFLLPPEMMVLFKPSINFLSEHATDPDKRRYAVPYEGPRHFIDIDHYGAYPYLELPRKWTDAVARYGKDSLEKYGIVPWHCQFMLTRLTMAFKEKNLSRILKTCADIGHYIADAHVPLHTNSNHDGQFTGQKGIHAFWESRVPELLADKEYDFFIGKAEYIRDPGSFIWRSVLESAHAADSVLRLEKELTKRFSRSGKFAFEERKGKLVRQYSSAFTIAYDRLLEGMIERRMRQSIFAIASFWYTAWVNAGQPDLTILANQKLTEADYKEFESLNNAWRSGKEMMGRKE